MWSELDVEIEILVWEDVAFGKYVREDRSGYDVVLRGELTSDPLLLFWAHFTSGSNDAVYNNEYVNERFEEAEREPDMDVRNAIFKELNVIGLDDVPFIPLYDAYSLIYYWPWVKNYYGELQDSSFFSTSHLSARIWIDYDLKAELEYK